MSGMLTEFFIANRRDRQPPYPPIRRIGRDLARNSDLWTADGRRMGGSWIESWSERGCWLWRQSLGLESVFCQCAILTSIFPWFALSNRTICAACAFSTTSHIVTSYLH